jgi:hypothetical protein
MESMYPPHDWAEDYWPADWWPDILSSSNSTRWKITNAALIALSGSSGVESVSNKKQPWWDFNPDKFPHVCILQNEEKKSRFSYPNTFDKDMYSELELNVIGYCQDRNDTLDVKQTNLIRDIELALEGSTELKDIALDIIPQTVETDQGTLENFSIVHCKYKVKYIYNHAAP